MSIEIGNDTEAGNEFERDLSLVSLAREGGIEALLAHYQERPTPKFEKQDILTGYNAVKDLLFRNEIDQVQAADFLLLGYSNKEALEIVAGDGIVRAALYLAYGLKLENTRFGQPTSLLDSELVKNVYDKLKTQVGATITLDELHRFLQLGISNEQSARLLEEDGFSLDTLFVLPMSLRDE